MGAVFAVDITPATVDDAHALFVADTTLFGCCDFIAQCILIHRCWIVYGQNIRVIVVPSILAFAYLVLWMASIGGEFILQNVVYERVWGYRLALTGFITSMTVNALVTGLIVFKIVKVFPQAKSVTTLEDKSFRISGGNKLHSVAFIIIESGMALFAIQLARVVVTIFLTEAAYAASVFIASIQEMVNGITPTIILVRVSLGLSFHDKESLVEAVGSLQFAANSISEAGSIDQDWSSHIGHDDDSTMGNINQERRDEETGGSDDVQIVDRS